MKNKYLFFILAFTITLSQAQTINFTDINFKNALLAHVPNIDTNFDNEIEVSEAQAIFELDVSDRTIVSIDGIENFINLSSFKCNNNYLVSLTGLNSLPSLITLECNNNQLTSIDGILNFNTIYSIDCSNNPNITSVDLSQYVNLNIFDCSFNNLTSIDISQNSLLWSLNCRDNSLTTIDISNNFELQQLNVQGNQLTSLYLKNGNEQLLVSNNLYFGLNPDIEYICIDDFGVDAIIGGLITYGYGFGQAHSGMVNSYCTFVPGGGNYVITGQNTYDANNDGCDVTDDSIPNLNLSITDGTATGNLISNDSGMYSVAVLTGVYTVTPQLESYFTSTPANIVVEFPTATSPSIQDFCITSNGIFNDLEITILPLTLARPGFDASYSIAYKNKGTTTLSGDVNLTFNDDLIDYISSTPLVDTANTGELIWNYTDLKPFETREILLTINANTPTDPTFPLNNGDILDFIATINPVSGDETPEDNVFDLHQTVVNSYDPNDKTCLEGKTILPSEVGEYVTYMIRFENNGTASAVNIVVKDVIDSAKYDMNSLTVLRGSHDFVTKIRDTNIVEFIFEDIYLPFDDATNDGYVSFKIKTLPTLVENDTFENKAEIYFDYNPAIVTNLAQTTVKSVLGISDYQIDNTISYYPNPVKDVLYVNSKNNLKGISIYDTNGRMLLNTELIENQVQENIDVSKLGSGVYFIKIVSDKGQFIDKLVIE